MWLGAHLHTNTQMRTRKSGHTALPGAVARPFSAETGQRRVCGVAAAPGLDSPPPTHAHTRTAARVVITTLFDSTKSHFITGSTYLFAASPLYFLQPSCAVTSTRLAVSSVCKL
ncbi:hypothetical protein EVAR_86975_1 [Eumeta japonica]|uniref:Uncharacterized protein n=1 Tax=Eumeta variegata TaxID=151549 RepID=A0A4C1W870_EUMVA|nr:hypothetical protein EVAR_86975_1 [Eumeta japonica]